MNNICLLVFLHCYKYGIYLIFCVEFRKKCVQNFLKDPAFI